MEITTAHVGIGVTLFLAYNGFLVLIIRYLLGEYFSLFKSKLETLEKQNQEMKEQIAQLIANMPLQYVRTEHCKNCRDEWLRIVNLMDSKLTSFSERIFEKFDSLRKELYDRAR